MRKMSENRNILAICCVILTFFSIAPAKAGDHALVMKDADGNSVFVDVKTLKVREDIRTIWFVYDKGKNPSVNVLRSKILEEHDCKNERFRPVYIVDDAIDGSSKAYDMQDNKWMPSVPGTQGERRHQYVCSM